MNTADVQSVERRFGGRGLSGHTIEGEHVPGWPQLVGESLRAINHLTNTHVIPAPTVYQVLGELKAIGSLLPQTCIQLANGLSMSLQVLEVYDHNRDPARSVEQAVVLLNQALRKAIELGELLDAAQTQIGGQGYHTPESLLDDLAGV